MMQLMITVISAELLLGDPDTPKLSDFHRSAECLAHGRGSGVTCLATQRLYNAASMVG